MYCTSTIQERVQPVKNPEWKQSILGEIRWTLDYVGRVNLFFCTSEQQKERYKRIDKIKKLKAALHLRMYGNPDEYYEETAWKSEDDAICTDMPAAIEFLQNECTDEELYWLGEVFDDIMDKTRSSALLDSLQQRVQSVKNPEWKQCLMKDIRTASESIQ